MEDITMAMTNRNNAKLDCMIYYTLDELVPQDHLVRKMEEALDFRFIYPKVQHLYSRHGRPSIDPVVLFKMLIINIVFGINSMRKTCQEIEVNLAYRWFLGLSIDEKIPNFSTWSQNYIRRYKDSTIFQEIFMEILEQAVDYGFVDFTTVFGDSTHQKVNANKRKSVKKEVEILKKKYEDDLLVEINEDRECIGKEAVDYGFVDFTTVFGDSTHQKANANKRKSVKKEVEILKKKYEDDLLAEINEDRECIGKEAFDSMVHAEYVHDEETGEEVKKTSTKTITESTIDPESGCFHKGEKEKCFAYSHQTFCDKNSFVLAVTTVPGNVHDSVSFFDAYEELINGKYGYLIKNVSLDAGYMTPAICRAIVQNDQIPYMPYKRPMTKKGFFKKYEYVYDEEYDCYLCPNDKILMYTTTTRNGYRQYKSDPKDCKDCPLRNKCTKSKNMTKVIERHLWEEFREYADEIRHTMEWKEIYPQRKETIERVFADCKENNGLRFTRLKGLKKNQQNAWLIFACHNLKKMSLWRGKCRKKQSKNSIYPSKYTKKDNFISKIAYIQ